MVKVLTFTTLLEHSWTDVTKAIWQKYPNPFASHVQSADIIEQRIDPETGILHTTRLFLKKGNLPKWGHHLMNAPEAFILEKSAVDPVNKTMTTVTRNLSHVKLMFVEETQTVRPDPNNPKWTQMMTDARIISNTALIPFRARIEKFGLNRFKANAMNSTKGLIHVIEQITQNKPIL
ncbi:hypothetical protein BATDEDRAFT_22272 [Batrachochytrium dendrobatidis JAM81]|uniref:PRELI/MSF1 domain-containing protein n=2 Tax=Batrachochytrium dendrobatidis TaxID=109871 RepID=F4NTI4_BATDJ|nr:uncharacterized protein BATDEDRAFT_22272 [Batrachochytrium dendrobatidis JAM81]EGF83509.1 hypothetical protein BATDEDRAFT_22272 [Batrachochytrium dendrobatidis JAM81]KAJ8327125.1 hypothetical protein O5D80_004539 [Batrachochytrium dendrobatidis]KAK5667969.1 hypothetical protein QVD99_005017 [Batrachochytrium dendrobatidis]OAJ37218.1 hypothetical protein BDEG_21267 [Batrachochytrium dendrobatidis JEL423]|eukprot:XP_006675516.1 hypothetical protein BATDEDRAFT_22272 [Batrachochytrium dendrobatidis JAM81]